jgi:hypothetical protein
MKIKPPAATEYMISVTRDKEAYHSLLLAVPAVLFLQEMGETEKRKDKSVMAPFSAIFHPSGTD